MTAPAFDWRTEALCARLPPRTADYLFHPDRTPGDAHVAVVSDFCEHCPVVMDCLQAALAVPQSADTGGGIFAGLTAPERRRWRRDLGVETVDASVFAGGLENVRARRRDDDRSYLGLDGRRRPRRVDYDRAV